MKKGAKKYTAKSESFNALQMLRYCIKDKFNVTNVRWGGRWDGKNWGGRWDGKNWENFSFYCSTSELKRIESFCKDNQFNITFN